MASVVRSPGSPAPTAAGLDADVNDQFEPRSCAGDCGCAGCELGQETRSDLSFGLSRASADTGLSDFWLASHVFAGSPDGSVHEDDLVHDSIAAIGRDSAAMGERFGAAQAFYGGGVRPETEPSDLDTSLSRMPTPGSLDRHATESENIVDSEAAELDFFASPQPWSGGSSAGFNFVGAGAPAAGAASGAVTIIIVIGGPIVWTITIVVVVVSATTLLSEPVRSRARRRGYCVCSFEVTVFTDGKPADYVEDVRTTKECETDAECDAYCEFMDFSDDLHDMFGGGMIEGDEIKKTVIEMADPAGYCFHGQGSGGKVLGGGGGGAARPSTNNCTSGVEPKCFGRTPKPGAHEPMADVWKRETRGK